MAHTYFPGELDANGEFASGDHVYLDPASAGSDPNPLDFLSSLQLMVRMDEQYRTLNGDDLSAVVNPGLLGGSSVQTTAADQPLWIASDSHFNGAPSMHCDSSDEFLDLPNLSSLTAAHIFCVAKHDTVPTVGYPGFWKIGTNDAAGDTMPSGAEGTFWCGAGSTTRENDIAHSEDVGVKFTVEVLSTSAEFTIWVNENQIHTDVSNIVGCSAAGMLGKSAAGLVAFEGKFAELVICGAEQDAGERAAWYAYQATRYG